MNNLSAQKRRRFFLTGLSVPFALLAMLWLFAPGRFAAPASAETTKAVTAPPPKGREMATFAAGCFWSMEAIFKQLKGVDHVDPGYSGGSMAHPSYEQVENGNTGYAETVNITFDPKVISYRELLQVLLTVRDPTTKDRQGNDEGPQYRSVIFYRSDEQRKTAETAIKEITGQHIWSAPIVTAITPYKSFWRAEDYHLNYYALHPENPYCANVVAPEIEEFRKKFHDKLKS